MSLADLQAITACCLVPSRYTVSDQAGDDKMEVPVTPPFTAQTRVKPFLKWAGGKSQLLPALAAHLPDRFGRYHEPFLGGGALFFALASTRRLHQGATLADTNSEIITCYEVVRDQVEDLIAQLWEHDQHKRDEDYYYEVRNWDTLPDFSCRDAVTRAARTLFLNRTCFNGLYRQNRKGEFNVPFGRYANPTVCDPDLLRAAATALRGVDLYTADFASIVDRAEPGDLVYFDPPYLPLTETASFANYVAGGFGIEAHRRLAITTARLMDRGVHVMLSNSDTPLSRRMYGHPQLRLVPLMAARLINSAGDRRDPVPEILLCSPGCAAPASLSLAS